MSRAKGNAGGVCRNTCGEEERVSNRRGRTDPRIGTRTSCRWWWWRRRRQKTEGGGSAVIGGGGGGGGGERSFRQVKERHEVGCAARKGAD
ncbi:hypothetical protein GX48_05892 [Paracoccidioides brasiliensis]|nr:hypothetical protein GX48_05892 [Paracoccidioides brasiliensis]